MSWFSNNEDHDPDFIPHNTLEQVKAVNRSVKTQTEMMALRLDSIKRSVDIQAVALIYIMKLLAFIASKDLPKDVRYSSESPGDLVKKMLEEIKWIKAFTNSTGE